jgi:hypothetical protein
MVVTNEGVAGMFAGHQNATRRGAYRAAGAMLRELHTFRRKFIQRRSVDNFLPVRPDVSLTQIIGQNKNNVRLARWFGSEGSSQCAG